MGKLRRPLVGPIIGAIGGIVTIIARTYIVAFMTEFFVMMDLGAIVGDVIGILDTTFLVMGIITILIAVWAYFTKAGNIVLIIWGALSGLSGLIPLVGGIVGVVQFSKYKTRLQMMQNQQ